MSGGDDSGVCVQNDRIVFDVGMITDFKNRGLVWMILERRYIDDNDVAVSIWCRQDYPHMRSRVRVLRHKDRVTGLEHS